MFLSKPEKIQKNQGNLKEFLDELHLKYNHPDFIADDPISIPHRFTLKQDIEISGLFAAIFAWGQRKTIINKSLELMAMMDQSPYEFIMYHKDSDLKPLVKFKHRTFNATDLLYFILVLRHVYTVNQSLEDVFYNSLQPKSDHVGSAISGFRNYFFSLDHPHRTKKHISTPDSNSACKRINMYLRWMVRKDNRGVDFGLWNKLRPDQLICPCDIHVENVSRKLGLVTRKKPDWQMALELTENLKRFDSQDPVKYDFSLFGLGVNKAMDL